MFLVLTLLLVQWAPTLWCYDMTQCTEPLGMENGNIPDRDITATSCFNDQDVGPRFARLNRESNGGAWCPGGVISKKSDEWLEINLHDVYYISGVAIQGRFGNGDGIEYAETYMIEYWRPKQNKWLRYRSELYDEFLPGNINQYIVSRCSLSPPTWASKIRFIPYSEQIRYVCLRVEIYGCYWEAGIVAYTIPKGDSRSNGIQLTDRIYDGQHGDELKGGLGLLVDGKYGGNEIREAAKNSSWVGWRNDSTPYPSMLFEFDKVREFRTLIISCNNKFKRDVEIFSEALISFSIGGRHFQDEVIRYWNVPDKKSELSRNISIHLHHRIARFVRIQLKYYARWILISEVTFDSDIAHGHHNPEYKKPINEKTKLPPTKFDSIPTPLEEDPVYMAIIVGVIALLAILLAVGVALIVHHQRHRKCFASPVIKAHKQTRDSYGRCATSILNNKRVLELPPEVKSVEYSEPYQEYDSHHRGSVVLEMQEYKPANLQDFEDYTESSAYGYAVPEMCSGPLVPKRLLPVVQPHRLISFQNRLELQARLAMVADNPGTMRVGYMRLHLERPKLMDFPRHRLRLVHQLCEGTFGNIYIAVADGVPEYGGFDTSEERLTAVRFCYTNHTHESEEFERDVAILSALSSPYLVRVLGTCRAPPFAVVMEYLDQGDLCNFLRKAPLPTHVTLLHIAEQIAAGMKYLESLNFVHSDLATRNCLISSSYDVKIGDFAIVNDQFSCDYHGIMGRLPIPVRWAAWETVISEKYSTKSDVWSFGVTLHEIFTQCRRQPYAHMSNSEVLENLTNMAENTGLFECVPRCGVPVDLYTMMQECWKRNEADRPSFLELHLFLMKKLDTGSY